VIPMWTVPAGERPTGPYSWGGFAIASNLHLPRLWLTDVAADTRFRWRFDPSPPQRGLIWRDEIRTRDGDRHRVAILPEGVVRYQIGRVGLYLVRADGPAIDFFPSGEADPMRVEHFLVNAILPIYAGLRFVVCLHASAVARDGWAIVFAGPSRSGKSTKALEALDRGGILLGDDTVAVRRRGKAWLVYPGARTMRLEEPPPGPSWRSGPKYEWFVASSKDPSPLAEVVVLDRGGEVAKAALRGSGLLRALLSLEPSWVWGDVRMRRASADQTAALCYSVIRSVPSLVEPSSPPVRSQTLPSGSSVGGSYGSGQGPSRR
jgi:hypothetical protein